MTGAKRKTIVKILSAKINDWTKSITDNCELVELIKRDAIITGGAITSLLLGEEINDYDVYFVTQDTAAKVAQYYVDKFVTDNPDAKPVPTVKVQDDRVRIFIKSSGIAGEGQEGYEYFEYKPEKLADAFIEKSFSGKSQKRAAHYNPIYLSDNAITLGNKLQIIIRFYGPPEELHKNFDFVHATNSFEYDTRELILVPEALEATLARELVYVGSKYPVASIFRIRKFIGRGWRISAGQILKILLQVNDLDLSNIDVLEEQLIGVDVAYMKELIDLIRKHESPDTAYICKLIDEVF